MHFKKLFVICGLLAFGLLGLCNSSYPLLIVENGINSPNNEGNPMSSSIPNGIIGIWTGTRASIPQGWILCDGNSGTLNFSNRFPYGTDMMENAGDKTDTLLTTHNHTYTTIPQHSHTVSDPGHSHSFKIQAQEFLLQEPGTIILSTFISGFSNFTSNTTGITIQNNGTATTSTNNQSILPPYYKVAFIMKGPSAPATIPAGVIFMWNSTLATIPSGWVFCDGTSSTPNLTNRIPMGINSIENPGTTGGSASHSHVYTQLPQHTHTITDPGHNHQYAQTYVTEYETGTGTQYGGPPPTSYLTETSLTGISLGLVGAANPMTSNTQILPPYFKVAYVQAQTTQTSIPKGVVAMWGSTWNSVPSYWRVCNGTGNTPDLTFRFPLSVNSGENAGATGGNTTHRHNYQTIPLHSHAITDPGHTHTANSKALVSEIASGTGSTCKWFASYGTSMETTSTKTTGISVNNAGSTGCQTDIVYHVPPYIQIIYIQHMNSPPQASNLQFLPENPKTGDNLGAFYNYTDAESGLESGTEIRWYKNGVLQTAFNNQMTIPHGWTNKSQEWYFTVTPSDGIDTGILVESVHRVIGNTVPVASNLKLLPATPITTQNLGAFYNYTDADGDSQSGTQIRWYKNTILQTKFNDVTTIPASFTNRSEVWYFTVQPRDGTDLGTLQTSSSISIQNSAPTASNLQISPTNANELSDLIGSYTYSDIDGDSQSGTQIRWYRNGTLQSRFNDLLSVSNVWTNESDNWHFTALPRDGIDFGTLQTSANRSIVNQPPTASNLLLLPVSPLTNANLGAFYNYSDPEGISESGTEIRWYRNSALQTRFNNVKTIPAAFTNRSDVWYFTVKPKDGMVFGTLQTSASRTIGNTAPVASAVIITPDHPNCTSTLSVSYTYTDADGNAESGSTIRWYQNGVLQTALNDRTDIYDGQFILLSWYWVNLAKGDTWYYIVTPRDGTTSGTAVQSASKTIENAVPSADGVFGLGLSLTPANPTTTSDLVAGYTFYDPDGDLDITLLRQVRWYRNTLLQDRLNNLLTIPHGWTNKSQTWYFEIRVFDGTAYGPWVTSDTVTILNTAPTASNLLISPTSPTTNISLTASYTFTDIDADGQSGSQIRWYRNGKVQSKFNNLLTIPHQFTNKTDKWHFTVQPNDGQTAGSTYTSANRTILNTAPTISNLQITPSNPTSATDLNLSYDFYDIDNDNELNSQIRWYRNSGLVSALNNLKAVPANWTNRSDVWYCSYAVSDGTNTTSAVQSGSVTIINAAPALSDVMINPASPTTIMDLQLQFNFTDPDGDSAETAIVRWYCNSVRQNRLDNSLYVPAVFTNRTDKWYATIQPYDGFDLGPLYTSAMVTVINAMPKILNLEINPYPVYDTDSMTLSFTFSDDDNDPFTGSVIQWYRNAVHLSIYDNIHTIPANETQLNQVWSVSISVSDGSGYIEAQNISNIGILGNDLPLMSSPQDKILVVNDANSVIWTVFDPSVRNPTYSILVNGTIMVTDQPWESEVPIIYQLPNLAQGRYNITIQIFDGIDAVLQDSVIIQLVSQDEYNKMDKIDPGTVIAIVVSIAAAVSIALFVIGTRRGWFNRKAKKYTTASDNREMTQNEQNTTESDENNGDSEQIVDEQVSPVRAKTTPSRMTKESPPANPFAQQSSAPWNKTTPPQTRSSQPNTRVNAQISREILPQTQIISSAARANAAIKENKTPTPVKATKSTKSTKTVKLSTGTTANSQNALKELGNAEFIPNGTETKSQIVRKSNLLAEKLSPHIQSVIEKYEDAILTATTEELDMVKQNIIEESRTLISQHVPSNPVTINAIEKLIPKEVDKLIGRYIDSLADE